MSTQSITSRIGNWASSQATQYRGNEDRPLGGYLTLISAYGSGTALAAITARALGRSAPPRHTPWDVTLLAIATHKLARLVAKDPITSPLRAPFTSYEGTSAAGELAEQVRGHGLQHSIGELVTCPMCLAQWVATGFMFGRVFAPHITNSVMATLAAVSGADFLQHLYVRLQQATE